MRGFRSRPAEPGGPRRSSREDAEAEAAAELRRVMERAGGPAPASAATGWSPPADERPAPADERPAPAPHPPAPSPPVAGPEPHQKPPREPVRDDPPAGAAPQAVRRVRKSPPGAGRGRP